MSQIRRRQMGGGGGSMPVDTRPPQQRYLTFEVTKGGPIEFTINATTAQITSISYSLDNGNTWVETVNPGSSTTVATPKIKKNHVVLFKGSGTTADSGKLKFISSDAEYGISGNMASLLSGDSFISTSHGTKFKGGLFKDNTSVVYAHDLYIDASGEYDSLFNGCSSIRGMSPAFMYPAAQNWKNGSVLANSSIQGVKIKFNQGFGGTFSSFTSNCTEITELYIYCTTSSVSSIQNICSASLPANGTAYLGGKAWDDRASITRIPNTWTIIHIDENFNVIS